MILYNFNEDIYIFDYYLKLKSIQVEIIFLPRFTSKCLYPRLKTNKKNLSCRKEIYYRCIKNYICTEIHMNIKE